MSVSCNKEYPYQKVTPIDTPASVSLIVRDLDGEVALMAPKKKTFTLQIQARAIADELLTAIIKADPSLVESYNQAHGTSYEAVPAEAYEITTDRLFLPRYNTVSSTSELTLKSAGMQEDGKAYLLPLTIAEIKSESAHEFDMSDDDRTVYVIFRRIRVRNRNSRRPISYLHADGFPVHVQSSEGRQAYIFQVGGRY